MPVTEITKIGTKTLRYTKTEVYRKGELEAKFSMTSEQLANGRGVSYDLTKPSEETHLLNVSVDLEQLDANIFWPNVYLNGRDDNSFDFKKLIPPYAATTPDFVVRVRAYDDRTTDDYAEPNYSGMGNYGKCLDVPFENESVKPIRVEFASVTQTLIEETPEELVITFKEGSQRAAIGIGIEYKPLDGKKVAQECYHNCLTNERTLSIFDL